MQADCPLCDWKTTITRDRDDLLTQMIRHITTAHDVQEVAGVIVHVLKPECPA
jgi:predicted small metal-binding protein